MGEDVWISFPSSLIPQKDGKMDAWLVILLVMLGGGASVLIAYAVMRHFFPANDDDNFTMRPQQLAYMRDVRERNLEGLYAGVRPKHHPKIKRPGFIHSPLRQQSRSADTSDASSSWA